MGNDVDFLTPGVVVHIFHSTSLCSRVHGRDGVLDTAVTGRINSDTASSGACRVLGITTVELELFNGEVIGRSVGSGTGLGRDIIGDSNTSNDRSLNQVTVLRIGVDIISVASRR
jgi:hypothetical protein